MGEPRLRETINHDALAKHWNCSVRTLLDRARRGSIPKPFKIEKDWLFYLDEIIQHEEKNKLVKSKTDKWDA